MKEKTEELIEGLQEIQKGFLQLAQAERVKSPDRSYQNFVRAETCRKAVRELERNIPRKNEVEGGGPTWWYVCPECHGAIDRQDHYCKHCGQAVEE